MKIAAYVDNDSGAGIWGLGETEEDAKAHAEAAINDGVDGAEAQSEIASLKFAPVSDPLLERLADEFELDTAGFIAKTDVPYLLGPDGILWIDEDAEPAEDDDEEEEETSDIVEAPAPATEG